MKGIKEPYWIVEILAVLSFIILALLWNRISKEHIPKYKVEGQVRVIKPSNSLNGFDTSMSNAIWLIDSFRIVNSKITYTNSNGYVTWINPPYKIYEYSTNKLIDEK